MELRRIRFLVCCEPEFKKRDRETGKIAPEDGGLRLARSGRRGSGEIKIRLPSAKGAIFEALHIMVHPNHASTFRI
jgi:hypothetical protein